MYTNTQRLEDGRIEIKADLIDIINLVAKNTEDIDNAEERLVQCYIQDGNLVIHLKE
ncbi:UNVERIFIED_CONTAM: hypothetical protein ABIC26_002634 [Paenibacillus sp. PvR008]